MTPPLSINLLHHFSFNFQDLIIYPLDQHLFNTRLWMFNNFLSSYLPTNHFVTKLRVSFHHHEISLPPSLVCWKKKKREFIIIQGYNKCDAVFFLNSQLCSFFKNYPEDTGSSCLSQGPVASLASRGKLQRGAYDLNTNYNKSEAATFKL